MTNYAVYDTATGRIVRVGTSSSSDVSGKAGAGEAAIVCDADLDADYIAGGSLAARPVLDISALSGAVAGTAVSLSGLPEGATVTATPESGDVETDTVTSDGVMDITFATAGSYSVSVSEVFPTRPASIEVEVS